MFTSMPDLSWTGQPSLCGIARLDLVVSFLISMLRLVHSGSTSTHISTLHTLRTHTHCERAPSVLLGHEEGENLNGSEESGVYVALFGQTCRSGTGCSRPAALTFDKISKVCKKGTKCTRTVTESARAWPLTRFSSAKHHFLSSYHWVAEKTPWCDSVLGQRKQWFSISTSQWNIVTVSKGKKPSIWWFMP